MAAFSTSRDQKSSRKKDEKMSVSLGKRAPKAFGPEALDHEQGGSRETLYGGICSFEQLRV